MPISPFRHTSTLRVLVRALRARTHSYAPKHLNKEPGVSAYDAHLGESAKGIDFKAIYNATGTVSERRKIKGIKMNKMSSKAILLAKLKENKGKTAQQRRVEMNRAKAMAGAAKKKAKKG